MKNFFSILMLALLTFGGCNKYDHDALESDIRDLKNRVAALEMWTETVNSNITALQNIVAALQNMDYITGVTTFASPSPGGYVVSFVKSGSITISNGTDGLDGADGKNGADGDDGVPPQISVRQDTDGVYYWTLDGEWIVAGGNKLRVSGEKGADGSNGQNGITPQLRINSLNIWEVSYNSGSTWTSLGVAATGADGQNGQDGNTPQLRINSGTGIWEISYNGGSTWTSLGVAAAGADGQNGQDGQNGIAPKIRINTGTGKWEISSDGGSSWLTTGVNATGDRGDKGDAIFAANGVDFSNSGYVEFTLADGISKIKVPKYEKLGLNFTQPGTFAAGETKTVAYTPEGNVAAIKFLNMQAGWKTSVNYSARKFTVTAPASFNSSNRGGEVIILVSDDDQNTIMRTVNFTANGSGGGGNDGGDDGGDDSGGSGDGGGGDGGTGGYITAEGYSGNTLTVYYTDGTNRAITKNTDNMLLENSFTVPANNKIIESIVFEGGVTVIAGRKADGSIIALKLSGGNLAFRNAVEGYIPIGTYSEFQLINTARDGVYRQEANIDLLDIEWTPIGSYSSDSFSGFHFSGTFDGNSHTLANLRISGNSDYAGLFGYSRGTVRNVHIISGSVSGKNYVGGVCGYKDRILISGCSNASLVLGEDNVGGVCGYILSGNIKACCNTGSVSGKNYVGGVCGYCWHPNTPSSYSIAACYNTGSVSGKIYVGGVCGSNPSMYVRACYNTGSVLGDEIVGGVSGQGYLRDCYWKDIASDDAINGGISIGDAINGSISTGTTIFAINAWPTTGTHQQWGTGDGSGDGKYWKSLGGWNGGNPVYPKLWFEE
ncbi:MAG: DUF4988 domain-containing protein [Bacteroidales bacterium]|jgi:hypothetical protein|nr:DUF4988 domain-containing protein [Bacteroidales bacterium]